MRGFCETGLLLLPKLETYDSRNHDYQLYLRKSIEKAVKYFKSHGITLECFTTDELANQLRPEGVEWVSSSAPEDQFFIKRNVEGMGNLIEGKEISDIYDLAREKYPAGRGLDEEQRFDIVVKRDKFSANKYIDEQKLIITMEHPQNSNYKIKTKENDGRIVMRVHHNNFVVSTILSGNPIDTLYIVQYSGSTKPLYLWEVEDAPNKS